jgi:hypothetical protein
MDMSDRYRLRVLLPKRHQIFSRWTSTFSKRQLTVGRKWRNGAHERLNFRNLSVQRSFLQYKSQCLKKVNVKYVINRLWHGISHIVPGISPRPISALQIRSRAWYGSLGMIPGPIWTFEWKFLFKATYTFELIIPFQVI